MSNTKNGNYFSAYAHRLLYCHPSEEYLIIHNIVDLMNQYWLMNQDTIIVIWFPYSQNLDSTYMSYSTYQGRMFLLMNCIHYLHTSLLHNPYSNTMTNESLLYESVAEPNLPELTSLILFIYGHLSNTCMHIKYE